MTDPTGPGRVAIFDNGAGARSVVRALRELGRTRTGAVSVVVHGPLDRTARFVREADDSLERLGSFEEALRQARATSAWLGPAPLGERLAFGEACARAGVAFIGPSTEALRRLVSPEGLLRLAAELGVAASPAAGSPEGVHLVEVIFVRQGSAAEVVGVADASLRLGGRTVLGETPAPALAGPGEAAARKLALEAAAAAGWEGLGVARLHLDAATQQLSLAGLDFLADAGPAVEATTGIDLIRLALRLAAGGRLERLPVAAHGHAFAATVLASDPEQRLPSGGGRVELLRHPGGLGVRCDAAVSEGDELPPGEARPLFTIVARGEDRGEAAARLDQALADADVLLHGTASSKSWLAALCARPEVRAGRAGIGLVDRLRASGEKLVTPRPEVALVAAAIEAYDAEVDLERARFLAEARRGRPRVGPSVGRTVELRNEGQRHRLEVQQIAPQLYRVTPTGGAAVEVRVERLGRLERRLAWGDRRERVLATVDGLRHVVHVDGVAHVITREPAGLVVSPMPAVVVAFPVEVGQEVAAGDPVARIESMKVETVVTAPEAGIVRELLAAVNGQVDAGGPLVRLQPLGERPAAAAPLALSAGPARPAPATPRDRYLAALLELRRLLLGFDAPAAAARRLADGWRELAASVAPDDAEVLRAEDEALAIFGELEWLFTRARQRDGGRGTPPLEELWRYLHEPAARGEGLSVAFTRVLRRALSHYGVSMEAPGNALELSLLRIQKAHERVAAHLAPILALLDGRLAAGGVPPGLTGPGARDLLDHLVDVGQERFPGLGDLARELRYRRFDQPALEEARNAVYAQAEADLARLATAPATEVAGLVERLVECPQPIATLIASRMAAGPATLRPRLVEALLRRYYRLRPLGPIAALEVEGTARATADYDRDGQGYRVVACYVPAGDAAAAARRLARVAAEAPAERQVVLEAYLWQEGPALGDDQQAEALRALLAQAGFTRPVLRVSVVLATGGRGLGNQASQQHFTFRGGPEGFVEDRLYRGVHFMMFQRMQLDRLSKFDLERLPSDEDVYLYRGVARGNPKDERLFAAAEVRDLTPVKDAEGRVVQLPHLERMLHEALAGMRRFQARRPAHQRLEWNRVLLTVSPPFTLSRDEIKALAQRLVPSVEGLGLEMVLVHARVPDPATGRLAETLLRMVVTGGDDVSIRWDVPAERPLEPMAEYQQKVVQLRRRGLIHPFELVRLLAPPRGSEAGLPPGEFVEYDLDGAGKALPVQRPPGQNSANVVMGVVTSFTPRHPEGMKRVILLGDPGREMGSVAEPECRRILAALELAQAMRVPLEWFEVCAGAKISMTTGTENMDWVSAVLRKIIEFTQAGGEINVLVMGITVGAQPYWNAEATMLMHTRGILVMIPGASMVLTGKQALEYSGSVSAEDNEGIGGYDRIMGPNGQAQYQAGSAAEACQILMRHYDHCYVAPGERFPRRAPTSDPLDRDVRASPHGPDGGAGFVTVGDVFSKEKNPDRKKPFEIRRIMAACIDQDHAPLERWRDVRGGDTGVVWDAHLGGWPVCLVGIQSRPLPRLEFVPADGPEFWSAGTLFPQSSKKIARAVNAASGNRPLVVLANLSGFDGSPESMRRLQLEYGAEIGRAVVNFQGPIVFCVVSRYHGGAFVVFAKTLKEDMEVVAVEGARASVIGGSPAAAVVFARDVETRTRKDPRVVEAEKAAAQGGAARAHLTEIVAQVRSEKLGEVGDEFDKVHSVERALQVGSLDQILAPAVLRPWLVAAVERGIARTLAKT